jgi:hypothetical protein
MFCPSCGSDQAGQYCRACGTDLRSVRVALDKPEAITVTGSAREEIGRAVADKIRELKSAKELSKVVEGVLPEIDKFLEPPEEKRLRRIRQGTVTAAIGLATGLAFTIFGFALKVEEMVFLGCLGFVLLLIGLGVMVNGWYFTVAGTFDFDNEPLPDNLQKTLRTSAPQPLAPEPSFSNSVTEHTTHQLPEVPIRTRKAQRE